MSHAIPSPYPAPGEIIGEFWRVEKLLGEGGMGAVARAYNLVLHNAVAIKFMNPQFLTFPGAEERFINEGKASALIKSDHVVPVMAVGKTQTGTPYLVMECLDGVDLADLLARDGSPGLPIERAIHFVVQVLRGLQAAHAIGIIHRDMKPSNCFAVNKDGEEDFVKILDFGISKIQQPGQSASLTQTNSALGTPLYMSPEQARSPRDVDVRSDLYSVGVILYELLTGHTPFFSESGEFTEILFKLFTAEPPPVQSTRPEISDALAAVVHKALAREVNDRYSTAVEMAEALADFAAPHTQPFLQRMRAFKPPPKGSIAPPEDLPQSMVAFSQLPRGPATDVMPHRPTTDVMKGPPVTQLLGDAHRIKAPAITPQPTNESGRMSAAPADVTARARPDEAGARTQFETRTPSDAPASINPGLQTGARVHVPGAQTDLGAARDATPHPDVPMHAGAAPEKKRSAAVYALPVFAVLVIAGIGFGVVGMTSKGSGKGSSGESSVTMTSEPPSSVTASSTGATNVVAPPVSATSTTSATSVTSATASASASATPSATALHTGTGPVKPPPTTTTRPTHPTSTSALDTTIHQ